MVFPHETYNFAHEIYAQRRAENIPDTLYRYRSCSTNYFDEELYELSRNRFYIPSRLQLNDPQDCSPLFKQTSIPDYREYIIPVSEATYIYQDAQKLNCTFEQSRKIFRGEHKKWHVNMMMNLYMKDRDRNPIDGDNVGVLSLTDLPNNNAMWSMYADRFRGYVQVFEVIENQFGKFNSGEPVKVEYHNQKETIDYFGMYYFLVLGHSTISQYLKRRILKRFLKEKHQLRWLYTKSLEWSYEREIRCISTVTKQYVDPQTLRLSGIIVGHRIQPKTLEEIKRSVDVPISYATPSTTSYDVDITSVI